jgi:hypothetical protein
MPTPGTPIPAADVNLAQQRNVGPSTIGTTDQTAAAYLADSQVDTITVPVVNGRVYRIAYVFHYTASGTSAAGNAWTVKLKAGTASGTQLTYASAIFSANPALIHTQTVWVEWTASSSGNQQFTATAVRSSGSNLVQFKGATSQPRILSVEWLGQYA